MKLVPLQIWCVVLDKALGHPEPQFKTGLNPLTGVVGISVTNMPSKQKVPLWVLVVCQDLKWEK